MDNGLPESVGELLAHQEFYKLIEAQCDSVRTGKRPDLSPAASKEQTRVLGILHKIEMKLARLAKKVTA